MIVNQRTIDLIKQWEGCKLTAYEDVAGVWTIGYGTTANAGVGIEPHEGMTITQEQANDLLHKTIDNFAPAVFSRITVPVTSNEFGACLSLAYNIGLGAFAKSTVLRELNAGNKSTAANAFHMWNKAGGVRRKGLMARRDAEVELFLSKDNTTPDMHTAPAVEEKSETTTIIRAIPALIGGNTMVSAEVGGIVRALVSAAGGYLVAKGVVDSATATTIGGAAATIIVAAWSVWSKRKA